MTTTLEHRKSPEAQRHDTLHWKPSQAQQHQSDGRQRGPGWSGAGVPKTPQSPETCLSHAGLACIKHVSEAHFHLVCTLSLIKTSCRQRVTLQGQSALLEGLMIPAYLNVIKLEIIKTSRQNGASSLYLRGSEAPRG